MRDFVERFRNTLRKMWKTMEFYLSLSAQVYLICPYQSCSGFLGYIYSPVKMPVVYQEIQEKVR